MILCGFVIYPVDFHEERGLKTAGKLLVSKVTKLRQNFDLILLRLINKKCVFEVDCEVEEFETLMHDSWIYYAKNRAVFRRLHRPISRGKENRMNQLAHDMSQVTGHWERENPSERVAVGFNCFWLAEKVAQEFFNQS